MKRIRVTNFGPLTEADIELGDLTVFVGPQATGKSVLLQLIKLFADAGSIKAEMEKFGLQWKGRSDAFLELFFGEGMAAMATPATQVAAGILTLDKVLGGRKSAAEESVFYIPAQRVIALRDGLTHPFSDFRAGDPFVVRWFSDQIHQLVQTELANEPSLFPVKQRLPKEYRDLLAQDVFGNLELRLDSASFQKRLVLQMNGTSLPHLVWSAGQREFVPLLLGLYWLRPSSRVSRRAKLGTVIIEEPEMGLHPAAVNTTMLLVLDLMKRGYRLCISTHSPHVLDVVWGLQVMQKHQASDKDVLTMFGAPATVAPVAADALNRKIRVYAFRRGLPVVDISGLDPSSANEDEAGWGGLTEFTGRVGDAIARVVSRAIP